MLKPILLSALLAIPALAGEQWTAEQATAWNKTQPWRAGANYVTSTAINQLEMWQASTFDPAAIDRELGYAQDCGINSVRVFLHNLLWEQDSEGFLKRMERFLEIADRHHVGVMFVLLDDVWDPNPKLGTQREPKPHVHNSGWVQAPGREIIESAEKRAALEPYIKGVLTQFKDDKRVWVWDLYNEPGNPNKSAYGSVELPDKPKFSLEMAKLCFKWAWEVRPSQPLTMGVWTGDWTDASKLSDLNAYQLDHSDIVSFHMYADLAKTKSVTEPLFRYNRPVVCTEYMARTAGSTLKEILPYFKDRNVGAIQWGFVTGKSQTQYPWETWDRQFDSEPKIWFHDLVRPDGKPFDQAEVDLYRKLTVGK